MAAQLMHTKGLSRRELFSWMNSATNSLPVPVSPLIRTVESAHATRAKLAFSLNILEFDPTILLPPSCVRSCSGALVDVCCFDKQRRIAASTASCDQGSET